MPVRFSEILQQLSEWRMEVDYDSAPDIDESMAGELVSLAGEFVEELFRIQAE
jgi:hypothetical protein